MKPSGILLAAGRGRRMGGNKQFHPVVTSEGEKPLVAAAFGTIAGGCERMFVVLGHRAEEVAATLGDCKFEIVAVDPDAPMIDSIHAGLRAVLHANMSPPILLQLGDHPALDPSTLEKILGVANQYPDQAIIPTFKDSGGHPALIPSAIAKKILSTPCPAGLRQFWLDHPELCMKFPVDDPSVVRDIDTA